MKKLILILLALCLCLGGAVSAAAEEPELRYTYIGSTGAIFEISSDGISSVDGSLNFVKYRDGEIVATIQREVGGQWKDYKTFTAREYGLSTSLFKHWALFEGYNYRCEFTYNVYINDVIEETKTVYTSEIFY